MKTIYAVTLIMLFGLYAARADTIYFTPSGWQYYNDPNSYSDENKNPINPDDIDWATSDVVIWYNAYMDNDFSSGVNGDWTINSMTFMPTSSSHYWWAQSGSTGGTVTISDSLNFYNALLPGTAKKFHLNVGTINIDIQNSNGDEQSVFLYNLYSLTVSNGINISQMGANKDGSFSIDYTGYQEDGVWKGGVSVTGDVNIANMSRFNAEYSVDFFTDGNFIANNVSEVQMNDIGNNQKVSRVGGVEITGNVMLTDVAKMNLSDVANLKIGGNLSAANSDVYFHGIGTINFADVGGISIDGGVDITDGNFIGSGSVPYMTIGQSFTMSAESGSGKSMNIEKMTALSIARDFNLTNVSFVGTEVDKAVVGGDLSFNSDFDFRKSGNLSVDGEMTLNSGANAMIGAFKNSAGGNAGIDEAGLKVGGVVTVNSGAKLGTWFNSDYGYNNYASAEGLNGSGELYLNKSTSFYQDANYVSTMVFNGSGKYSFNGGIYHYDGSMNKISGDTGMRQDFVMNGTGSQTIVIAGDSNWTGTVTVNSGEMLLTAGGSNTVVDAKLNGGIFASSSSGSALLNDLTFDGGAILASDSSPAIFVAGDFTVESGGMKIMYDGIVSETTVITNFLSWYSDNDEKMVESITSAMEDGEITLWAGSIQCKIIHYDFDGYTLTLTFELPEPATIAAIFGAFVLIFALSRRRK